MRLTKHEPTKRHRELKKDLDAIIRKYEDLQAEELLAISAQVVGMLLALQDQRSMTPKRGIEIVVTNIEAGNRAVVDGLEKTGGSA